MRCKPRAVFSRPQPNRCKLRRTICILCQGSVAECSKATAVIKSPKPPYTRFLVDSIPVPNPNLKWALRVELCPASNHPRDQVECGMWDVECGMWDVECGMWNVV
jgi:ABC-type oligopeptide transport system ATPase subunit